VLRYGFSWLDSSSGTYDFFATSRLTGEVDQAQADGFRNDFLLEVPDYFLHNASVQFNLEDTVQVTVGVRNIFDKEPPRISAAVTTIGNAPLFSGFDYQGRTFFMNTTLSF